MNIRKKILFNPSHLKSNKPDSSDNTTANTKNSAILDQSKTFRFSNPKNITTRRQRNYLKTISKQQKDKKQISYNFVATGTNAKKRSLMPSFSTMSNQNFLPIRKSTHGKKFLAEQDQLPPLISLKRTELLTSQNQRKLFNYPSSLHISSNKQLFRESSKKQQPEIIIRVPEQSIIGSNHDEIQRRKQKLNSFNVASFYTTHKSIALSKYSIGSKQNQQLKASSDTKNTNGYSPSQKLQKPSQFFQGKDYKKIIDVVIQSPQKEGQQVEESIEQVIEKNESVPRSPMKSKKNKQNSSNEWSATLKSSFTDSNKQDKIEKINNNSKSQNQSSLCESQQIDAQQVKLRKNSNFNSLIQGDKFGDQDKIKQRGHQDEQKFSKSRSSSQSSLYESYQVQTPQKRQDSKMNSNKQ